MREHIQRMVSVTAELSSAASSDRLDPICENLRLAASLEDLSVDTDIDGTGVWCSPAAAFDAANNEVTAKHIAGVIVFHLVWIAYETAAELASKPRESAKYRGKGVLGRAVILRLMGDRRFPHLRQVLSAALELYATDMEYFRTKEMSPLVEAGSIAAIGAEHLRCFRNSVIHGEIVPPTPEDWGESSEYNADNDPVIRQFHANIRLTLLLIQMLLRSQCNNNDELDGWSSSPKPSVLVLSQLHCDEPVRDETQMAFKFMA